MKYRLRIAFKWLMRAFAGHLFVGELFSLWDRIIAFDSLDILPLFAVAIFSFRRANLLCANTSPAAEVVCFEIRYTVYSKFLHHTHILCTFSGVTTLREKKNQRGRENIQCTVHKKEKQI